jgi:UDP-glucose 4-epimerase
MNRTILVTGGAGFIGSHACLEFLEAGYEVVVLDNLSNSSEEALNRVRELTGKELDFHWIDLLDKEAVTGLFDRYDFHAVVHFAGLKAVGESIEIPLRYWHNNITGTLNLLEVMRAHQVYDLVFSSSATVYGHPEKVPLTEDMTGRPTNPYGKTKLTIEQICRDLAASPLEQGKWRIALLRYFNPVGAHPSGKIGEDPKGIPNNLMPYIMQVAVGRRPHLNIFGNDYPTRDGTGVRDYLHVVDLAKGHVAAVDRIENIQGCMAINLGTGRGYSVLEMVRMVEQVIGRELPHTFVERRPGDVAELYADPSFAKEIFGWTADLDLDAIARDSWKWQSNNPEGYGDSGS